MTCHHSYRSEKERNATRGAAVQARALPRTSAASGDCRCAWPATSTAHCLQTCEVIVNLPLVPLEEPDLVRGSTSATMRGTAWPAMLFRVVLAEPRAWTYPPKESPVGSSRGLVARAASRWRHLPGQQVPLAGASARNRPTGGPNCRRPALPPRLFGVDTSLRQWPAASSRAHEESKDRPSFFFSWDGGRGGLLP